MSGLAVPKRLRGVKGVAHERAPRQERETAKRLGGLTIKGSGSGDTKGDLRVKRVIRVEAKCTTQKSFSVTRDMVDKIENAGLAAGELPAIEIEFLDPKGRVMQRVAVVPWWALDLLADTRREDK